LYAEVSWPLKDGCTDFTHYPVLALGLIEYRFGGAEDLTRAVRGLITPWNKQDAADWVRGELLVMGETLASPDFDMVAGEDLHGGCSRPAVCLGHREDKSGREVLAEATDSRA
jgi:hypothetical protein